jgi:multidrug efflux system membrane fusion protein
VPDDRNVCAERNVFGLLLNGTFNSRGTQVRRKIVISAGLLVAVLATGGILAGTHTFPFERPAPPPPAAIPTVPVVAGVVAQHDVPIYLTGVGTVIAYNTVVVRSQIQGQLVSSNFTEGQTVHTGDLLAQIDPRPYQAQVDQVTATRDRDQAQLTNAEANFARYSQLGA